MSPEAKRGRARPRITPAQILEFAEEAVAAAVAEVERLKKYRAKASQSGDSKLLAQYERDLVRALGFVSSWSEEGARIRETLRPK